MILSTLVQLSLRFRVVLVLASLALAAYGIRVSLRVKLDVFPEFVQPQVVVQTEAAGLSAEQVETLVTRPVESALQGIPRLESIRSESIHGLSVVTVVFEEDTDIFRARQMLAEHLAETTGEFPAGIKPPRMSQLTSSTMDLLKLGLTSDRMSPMDLRDFADWTLRPRLLALPGVARANVFGGAVRQIQVQIDPRRLAERDLSLQDILSAVRESTGVAGAGFINTSGQSIVLRTEGQSTTPEAVGNILVTRRGENAQLRLKDVTRVVYAPETSFGDALINGQQGVLMTLSAQHGANTLETTRAVEAALDDLAPLFNREGIQCASGLHRPATFIEHALANVRESLLAGGLLVGIILILFLLDLRTACISFVTIPLSLLGAVILLDRFNVTLNTMTLGGFAVAIGVVVDDAIIDVENILRRLRANAISPHPRPVFHVILDASIEVRSAVVYATFIVLLVFVPILMMTGLQGRFFAPLGVAFLLAVAFSLVLALTLTPALCLLLLGRTRPHQEPAYLLPIRALHRSLLRQATRAPGLTVGITLALCGVISCVAPFLKSEFLPQFKEGHFVLQVSAAPGTSLDELRRIGVQLSSELLADTQHIASVEQQIGRAEMGEDTWGPHRSEFHVELKPMRAAEESEVEDQIRERLASYPGIQSEVMTFLGDRLSETLSGETAQVVVNVFGDDLDQIESTAVAVQTVLNRVAGHADVQLKAPPAQPEMVARLDPDRLALHGFRPAQVLATIQTAFQGTVAAQAYVSGHPVDLTVSLEPGFRREPEQMGDLLLTGDSGLRVPLHELADVRLASGRPSILHEGGRRRQAVTCNVKGRSIAAFVAEAKQRVADQVRLPGRCYVVFGGAAEAQRAANTELLTHSGLAGVAMIGLLAVLFPSPRKLGLVLVNLPFALVGGVLAVRLSGDPLSLGSLVGFIALFGITTRNSIMLISHLDHLVRSEGAPWGTDTLLRGAGERLLPILMTALVTGLGLLPLALGRAESGREVVGPMAVVILGGLITSTALNLVILPAAALKWGRFGNPA